MRALIIIIAIILIPLTVLSAEKAEVITVFLTNGDHVAATELTLLDDKLSIELPYAKALQIDKEYIAGLTYESGKMRDIISESLENDKVNTTKGEILTGTIRSIDKDGLKINPHFDPEGTNTIPIDKISHMIFKQQRGKAEKIDDSDTVKVIFLNGDLLTGEIDEFSEGKFTFKPWCGEKFCFTVGQYQTIHNANTSKQYIEGGLAASLMNMLKNAGNIRSYSSSIFVTLIRGFIKSKDIDGAIYMYESLSDFATEPYVYRQIAEEFYRNELYELAIKAYKTVIDSNQTHYYQYDKLIEAYLKLDRKADAAATCEEFLANEDALARRSKNPIDLHLKAADLYIEIKNFAKAAEHLEKIIIDPNSREYKRTDAREKLIGIYKERGQLDTLISNYTKQLEQHDKTIGEGILLLITRYTEQGKFTKARVEFERLKQLGINEYIIKAEKIISDSENSQ